MKLKHWHWGFFHNHHYDYLSAIFLTVFNSLFTFGLLIGFLTAVFSETWVIAINFNLEIIRLFGKVEKLHFLGFLLLWFVGTWEKTPLLVGGSHLVLTGVDFESFGPKWSLFSFPEVIGFKTTKNHLFISFLSCFSPFCDFTVCELVLWWFANGSSFWIFLFFCFFAFGRKSFKVKVFDLKLTLDPEKSAVGT